MQTSTAHLGRSTAVLMFALALGVSGCTSGTGTASTTASTRHTTTSTPGVVATTSLEPERDVTVAGRHFKARCAGSGPSVILVADYGQAMDDAWGTVPQTLAASSRVCVYDRLGIGRSDQVLERQTFASLADDLDGVISALGLTRPVVVMGFGMGGPIALSWASRHETDARAVVVMDPDPPGFRGPDGALEKLLPPKDVGDPELSGLWAGLDRFNDPATNRESLDPRSWTAYSRLPAMSTRLYDLVDVQPPSWPAAVDAKKIDGAWRALQRRVLAMSSPSEIVNVPAQDAWPATIKSTLDRALRS
jgi:pimeloyl-ACP methyl ester carboxylesterase